MTPLVGEKSCLIQCDDCKQWFHFLDVGRWCEECFEKGLHKDMSEHFDNFVRPEMDEPKRLEQGGEETNG